MNKTLKKIIATVLLTCMISANLSIIGEYGISYALSESELSNQKTTTQNENVEFNSYFEGGVHSKTEKLENTTKLFVNIKVKNAGYLENPVISFSDVNFKIAGEVNNENIQSISENKITLNKLNNGTDLTLEIPVKVLNEDEVTLDNFEKETKTNFTATYIDANGKSNEISKQVVNKLLWEGTEGTEGILKTDVTKKIPYHIGEKYGVLLQFYIDAEIKDSKLPIKTTKIDVTVPTLNNIKPTSANVIATSTEATNGEVNGTNFTSSNYNYDSTTGVLTINTKNKQDKISWVKNVKDRYLVTFIFDVKEAYDYVINNTSKIEVGISAKSEIEVYNGQKTIVKNNAEKSFSYTAGEGATVSMPTEGKMIDFDIKTISEMTKGQIYANYEAKNKNETTYNINYYATVCNAELTDKIEFTQEIDQFLTEENTKNATTVAGNNYTYNKIVKINKDIFKKILGEDGSIKLANSDGTEIATIDKDTTVSEEKYTIYISEKNNNQLLITTSKPVAEGILTIEVEKAVKTNIDYTSNQMKNFKKLTTGMRATVDEEDVKTTKEIKLTEPKTEVLFEISQKELTTAVKNKNIGIRIILNTSDTTKALYKNPTFKIKLPSYIEKCNLNSYDIVMGDGLKIKSAKTATENGQIVINVELEGAQTEYATNAQYVGAVIDINVDLTTKTLTPTNTNKITMEYKNNNEMSENNNGTVEEKVNFIAPEGIVTANGISNYAQGKEILTIADEGATGIIATNSAKRTITITGKIINNYNSTIKDIVILGRIPAKGNTNIDTNVDLGSTFDTSLKTAIQLQNIETSDYTVYYSIKANANKDLTDTSNEWTTTFNVNAKSYMVVYGKDLNETKMIEFAYDVELPENLSYNNSIYEMYKIYYTNMSSIGNIQESKTSPIIELTTGKGTELSVQLSSDVETVREGQTVRMKAIVKNSGELTAKNVKINIPLPKYATFTNLIEGNYFEKDDSTNKVIALGTIAKNEEKEVLYYLKFNNYADVFNGEEITDEEKSEYLKFPKAINHKVFLTADNSSTIYSDEYTISLEKGQIAVELISNTVEGTVLKKGENLNYIINLMNISGNTELKNTIVTIPLPQGVMFKSATINHNPVENNVTTEGVNYNENTRKVTINVGDLENKKVIKLETEVQEFEGTISIMAKAKADETDENYSNVSEYRTEIVKLEVSNLTSTPKYVKEKEQVVYNLKLTNKGESSIKNIVITDKLPAELNFEKATYMDESKERIVNYLVDDKIRIDILSMSPGESININLYATANLLPDKNDKKISNKMTVKADNVTETETNSVENIIEYYQKAHDESGSELDDPTIPESTYKITGTAWIDSNKNGMRDSEEELLSNVKVILVNKSTNVIVKDKDTKQAKSTTTNAQGQYEFSNIEKGRYFVLFVYDAAKYSVTEYQKEGVDTSVNSDAIDVEVLLNGEKTIAGMTDTIEISNSNLRDIDIGLYVQEKFDLRLDKYISKITRTTPTSGTDIFDYSNEKLTKIEVLKKNLGKSSIVVEYKIVVKNEGAVAGYAKKVVDYLPKGVVFNTELNKDWYLSDNGNVYNTSLENTIINPGETKELTLVLVKQITEDSIGVLNNTAEIYEAYNEQGLKDIDSTPANKVETEDDMSKADIVLGIVTGAQIAIYIILPLVVISLLGFGIFAIRKRVLKKV